EVSYTTNLISELKSKGVFLSNSLYDDIWLFSHEYSLGRSIKLDFGKIDKNLNKDDQLLIKCWIGSLLEKYRPSTCIHYFHHFCMAVNITKFFSLDRINHFVEWLHEDHITNNEKTYVLSTVFSFFDLVKFPIRVNILLNYTMYGTKLNLLKIPSNCLHQDIPYYSHII